MGRKKKVFMRTEPQPSEKVRGGKVILSHHFCLERELIIKSRPALGGGSGGCKKQGNEAR